ncbi:MAG: glycosyltransferase family 39 protein, partial [Gemmatimonadota bacterium]|nr:glycosyltransferase family 39 protein [Gemmatimonadota bacterium]
MRLLPAVFGIVAVPLMFLLGKRLFGARAGLLAATLVAFSPWHIYWSQYGRYYTLVFLLSATFPILLFTGVQGRSPRVIMAGVALAVLAVL